MLLQETFGLPGEGCFAAGDEEETGVKTLSNKEAKTINSQRASNR